LDDFLRLGEHEILTHAGSISHAEAISKAEEEYQKYREKIKNELSLVEKHFLDSIDSSISLIEGKGKEK
ncbi:MAG: cell filamentation protein Fic, partial [Syntrophomonadaceae bacterium]|nr:cell filamentation protein Fic [Syntrophomonadaceae bacterium]